MTKSTSKLTKRQRVLMSMILNSKNRKKMQKDIVRLSDVIIDDLHKSVSDEIWNRIQKELDKVLKQNQGRWKDDQ